MTPASTRDLGLAELAAALRAGTTTSVLATTSALDRIEAAQPTLNAFRVVRREQALREAAEADRRLAAGAVLPLLGVPVAIKDDTDIVGAPTAFGCGGEFPPACEDAEVVRRLRAAGAVIVGKTNTCEIGQYPFTGGTAFGYTRNPWHRDHTPGGSSGGSAAAVSAGLVPAAIGSDGAGSVRIPASWTNLVGIKPQRGRISTWPLPESFNGLTVNGTLARTVADAALLLDVAAGPHPGDLHTPPPLTLSDHVGHDPGTLRIAVALNIPFTAVPAKLDPKVEARVRSIATVLTELGHAVTVTPVPYGLATGASFLPRSLAGVRKALAAKPGAIVDARTRANARVGSLLGGPVLSVARNLESVLHKRIGLFLQNYDVILAPTTARPPEPVHAMDGLSNAATDALITAACPYTFAWNVLGWPSINIPAGFTDTGLPVGAQLMGAANTEPLLVALASQLESELRWDGLRPLPWWEP